MTKRKSEPSIQFKLSVELIPETSFYNNLRKVVSVTIWDKLRKQTYGDYDHICGKCGLTGTRLECHELWDFAVNSRIQKLTGLIAVCRMCHLIIHHGYANMLILDKKLDKELLVQHFMNVNKCTKKQYEEHEREAYETWKDRSKQKWTVDLGEYQQYVIPSK